MFIVLIVFVVFTVFVLVVFIVLEFHSHSLSPSCFAIFLSLSGIDFFVHCRATSIQWWRGDESASNDPASGSPPPDAPAQKTLQLLALSSPVLTSKPLGKVAPST